MNKPLVTVIITAYNRAHVLANAIDSALAQTYDNQEILVVDDGSVDDTRSIVAGYGQRIRYVYKENGGLPTALNAGLEHAHGELVATLDSDDVWYPEKVERQVAVFESAPELAVVIADFEVVDEDERHLGESKLRAWIPRDGDILREVLQHPPMSCSALMFRKSALEEVGLFDETLRSGIDYDILVRLSARFPAGIAEGTLWRYHRSSDSMGRLARGGRFRTIARFETEYPERASELGGFLADLKAAYHRGYARDLLWEHKYGDAFRHAWTSLHFRFSREVLVLLAKGVFLWCCSRLVPALRRKRDP